MSTLRHFVKVAVAGTIALMVLPLVESMALAGKPVISYVPPNRGTATSGLRGSGSRGCPALVAANKSSSVPAMTLMVPNNHVGQTVSANPTFYIYVSTVPSLPMEFALVEPGVAQPLYVTPVPVKQPGIVKVETPQNLNLAVGKRYRWSVSLVCNPDRRSNDVFVQSWVERVDSAALSQNLVAAKTDLDRAGVFAQSGVWYDALSSLSKATAANPQDDVARTEFLALLDQAGLTQLMHPEKKAVN